MIRGGKEGSRTRTRISERIVSSRVQAISDISCENVEFEEVGECDDNLNTGVPFGCCTRWLPGGSGGLRLYA